MRYIPLLVGVLGLAAGCGGDRQIATVSGRVTLDGQPLRGARVSFQPVGNVKNSGVGSFGKTNDNGEYSLTLIDESAPGAIVGSHEVRIVDQKNTGADPTDDRQRTRGDLVPAEYNTKTTLHFEVKPGHNEANWPLVSKKK